MLRFLKSILLLVVFSSISLGACQSKQPENQDNTSEYTFKKHKKKKHKKHKEQQEQNANQQNNTNQNLSTETETVPAKAIAVLKYIRQHQEAMPGYVGGRKFGNYEGILPKQDENGQRINYQEWDVNPKQEGRNRGTERLVTSSTKAYYTNNHYRSFVMIKY